MPSSLTQNPHFRHFIVLFIFSSLLLGGFARVLYQQSQVVDYRNRWVLHSYEVMRQARHTMIHILDMETSQRGYLLTRIESFLSPYKADLQHVHQQFKEMKEMTTDNSGQQANIIGMEREVDRLIALLEAQIKRLRKSGANALSTEDINNGREAMNNVRKDYDLILTQEQKLLDERLGRAHQEQREYFYRIFSGTVLAILGLIIANGIILSLLTKSRRTEKSLAEFEERYRLVLQGVDDGIYDYDVEKNLVLYSPSYKRLLGYAPTEMTPTIETFKSLVHPEDWEAVSTLMKQYFHKEIPQFFTTFRMRHKDGDYRFILARGVGQWDRKGRIQRMIGTHTDITVEKQTEQKLRDLNEELESFTLIASHDLRAPLVNIKGFAGEVQHALDEVTPLIEKIKPQLTEKENAIITNAFKKDIPESLDFITSAVKKMDMLTNAILDLSRIGRRKYSPQKVAMDEVIKRCLDSLAYDIAQRHITVHRSRLPEVFADPVAIEQICGNILDNAVKYLDLARPGVITISTQKLPNELLFCIEDNGRGIAKGDKEKIFDIFRRAGNSGDVRGIGMGMAYIKAAVRRIGGRIWFESTLNKGTRFYFTVPNLSHV